MGYAILKDVEQGIAALIDPEAGRALGPIVVHDEGAHRAADLLESFVGGLGVDPATLTPTKLEIYWDRFLDTVNDIVRVVDDVATAADKVRGDIMGAAEGGSGVVPGATDPPKAQETAENVPPGPLTPVPEPPDVPEGEVAASPAAPPTGETIVPSAVACNKCDGFGTIADGNPPTAVQCPQCGGSGQMPAAAS